MEKHELADIGRKIVAEVSDTYKGTKFEEYDHIYERDGKVLPSVTQMMQWLGMINFDAWCPPEARERGNDVDRLIKAWRHHRNMIGASWDEFMESEQSMNSDVQNCIEAWKMFEDASDCEVIASDIKILGSTEIIRNGKESQVMWAGEADLMIVALPPKSLIKKGSIDPGYKLIHVDVKTSTKPTTYPSPVAAVQTAAYHAGILSSLNDQNKSILEGFLYRGSVKLGCDGKLKYDISSHEETRHYAEMAENMFRLMFAVRGRNYYKAMKRDSLTSKWKQRIPFMDDSELLSVVEHLRDGLEDQLAF